MRALRGTGDGTPSRRALREVAGGFINHPGQLAHSEAIAGTRDEEGRHECRGSALSAGIVAGQIQGFAR